MNALISATTIVCLSMICVGLLVSSLFLFVNTIEKGVFVLQDFVSVWSYTLLIPTLSLILLTPALKTL